MLFLMVHCPDRPPVMALARQQDALDSGHVEQTVEFVRMAYGCIQEVIIELAMVRM